MMRGVVLGAVVTYGLLVIALQPFLGRWLAAAFFVGLSLISPVAFLCSRETKGVGMEELDPVQGEIVTAEPRELAMNR